MAETTSREFAVKVRPTEDRSLEHFAQFSQIFERRKALEQEQKLAAAKLRLEDKNKMQDYLDKVSDPTKLYTGIPGQDKNIDAGLAAIVENATALSRQGYSTADIQAMHRPGVMEIGRYSNATKSATKLMDDDMKVFGTSDSLDMNKVKMAMYRDAFENYDDKTNTYSQKNTDDIKPVSVNDVIAKNPERFVKVGEDGQVVHKDLENLFAKSPLKNKVVDSWEDYDIKTGNRIERTKAQYSVDELLGQETYFAKDGHGNISPNLRWKFQEEGDLTDKNKTIKVVSDEGYNQYFSDARTKAALIVETEKRYGKDIDPSKAEDQQKMKAVALDLLEKKSAGSKITRLYQQGTTPIKVNVNVKSPEQKESDAEYKKGKSSPIYTFLEFASGKRKPDSYGDDGLAKISDQFPGGTFMTTKEQGKEGGSSPQAFEGIYVDRKNNVYYKETPTSKPKMIKPNEMYAFLKKRVGANAMPLDAYDKIYKEFYPSSTLGAEAEGYRDAYNDAVDDFTKDGKVTNLGKYMGDYFDIDLKGKGDKKDIKRVQIDSVTPSGNKYTVAYTSDGKEETKEFTKAQMEKILKMHHNE